jgi:arginine deiminase
MHLDTIFTFADRDCVLIYRDIVNTIAPYSVRPGKNDTIDVRRAGVGWVR